MRTRLAALALAAAAALAVAGCGGSGSSPSKSSAETTTAKATATTTATAAVDIKDFLYRPAEITVTPGAKVTWTNEDSSPHTATVKGGFDTDAIAQGKRATVTLTTPGTYAYYCAFHPYMHGTIVVSG